MLPFAKSETLVLQDEYYHETSLIRHKIAERELPIAAFRDDAMAERLTAALRDTLRGRLEISE